ncbi:MAG: GNAT family N-acetyltransferase [Candidatus Aenigmatarchaeota archaeon]
MEVLCAESDGKLVGFINGKIEKYPPIYAQKKYGFIWLIHVEESYRNRGIGKKLLNKFIAWGKEKQSGNHRNSNLTF